MNKITKAVIPCGGMGTRFLPITKAVPKEILPLTDTPVLAYIVDEAISSGITDILIILGKDKEAIKRYFSPSPALEEALQKSGKTEYLELVRSCYNRANIVFETQPQPLGSGEAVLRARGFTKDEPFALAWGDDLIVGETPVMLQLARAHEVTGKSILGVQTWPWDDIVKYGVAEIDPSFGFDSHALPYSRLKKCRSIVEKPPLDKLPSRLASLGRYLLTPEIYEYLLKTKPGKGGEIQFTDALNAQAENGGVLAYDFEGKRYDMGDKFGSLQATVELALKNEEYGFKVKQYIKDLAEKLC